MWTFSVEPADFRLLTGEDRLGDYGRSGDWGEVHHRFCTTCGIQTHGHGELKDFGGPFLSVRVAALDDLAVDDLVQAPVRFMDGLHDNWMNPPTETRHL